MRRKLSGSADSGSLDLLLDTLCNVFGGIVLIACLLAILPRQDMPPPLLPAGKAESQMVERRIVSAEQQIKELQKEIEKLLASVDPEIAALEARLKQLKDVCDELEKKDEAFKKLELQDAQARAVLVKGNVDEMKKRLEEVNRIRAREKATANAINGKVDFLKQRVAKLGEEIKNAKGGRAQAVRFPRERRGQSSPFPVVLKHNQIYPLRLGLNWKENPAIHRIHSPDGDGFRAIPLNGKGFVEAKTHKGFNDSLKKAARRKNVYISVYIYPDSHEMFHGLAEVISKHKLRYGIEFMKKGEPIGFSGNGTQPPEL